MRPCGSPPGILLAQRLWFLPALLLLGTIFSLTLTLVATRTALRVAWAPLACSWLLLGFLLSELQPLPEMQRELSSIADSGGAHLIEGEIERTTPVRLTQSTLPFSIAARRNESEQSESIDLRIHSVDGARISGGLRATIYGPAGRRFPLHCGDSIAGKAAMHLPEHYRSRRMGFDCMAAGARHRRDRLAQAFRSRDTAYPFAGETSSAGCIRCNKPAANACSTSPARRRALPFCLHGCASTARMPPC